MRSSLVVFLVVYGLHSPCPAGALTLEEALVVAHENHPSLRSAQAESRALKAEGDAAGRWSNPSLEVEAEGLGGEEEYTAMLEQEVPLSGRIGRDREVARWAAEAAALVATMTETEVEVSVQKAFVEALAGQELLRIRKEQVALANDALEVARKKHEAGAVSKLDVLQAEIALAVAEMDKSTGEQEAVALAQALAGQIGVAFPIVGKLADPFFQSLDAPVPESVPDRHPALLHQRALIQQAQAEAASVLSGRPDVTLGAGARYEKESGENTFLVAASVPLPLFTRSRDFREPARWRAEALHAESDVVRKKLEAEFNDARNAWSKARQQTASYRERLIPMAERAYAVSREGYEAGQRSWLELIAARQQLAEANYRLIEIHREGLLAQAELKKFIIAE